MENRRKFLKGVLGISAGLVGITKLNGSNYYSTATLNTRYRGNVVLLS